MTIYSVFIRGEKSRELIIEGENFGDVIHTLAEELGNDEIVLQMTLKEDTNIIRK